MYIITFSYFAGSKMKQILLEIVGTANFRVLRACVCCRLIPEMTTLQSIALQIFLDKMYKIQGLFHAFISEKSIKYLKNNNSKTCKTLLFAQKFEGNPMKS